jgi:hypothetical protein
MALNCLKGFKLRVVSAARKLICGWRNRLVSH